MGYCNLWRLMLQFYSQAEEVNLPIKKISGVGDLSTYLYFYYQVTAWKKFVCFGHSSGTEILKSKKKPFHYSIQNE